MNSQTNVERLTRSNGGKFRTCDLPFTAYLHSTRRLRFAGCEAANGDGRVFFTFEDPASLGDLMQLEFESGAECSAVAFYDSVRHLRRVMSRTGSKGAAKHGREHG